MKVTIASQIKLLFSEKQKFFCEEQAAVTEAFYFQV